MTKLKAVTLIELIVAMIIISLIMGIGYYGYQVIDRQFQRFVQTRQTLFLNKELGYVLNRDFDRCNFITLESDSSLLFYTAKDTIIYSFSERLVQRKANTVSFEYPTEKCKLSILFRQGRFVKQVHIGYTNLIDYSLVLEKIYSAEQILSDSL